MTRARQRFQDLLDLVVGDDMHPAEAFAEYVHDELVHGSLLDYDELVEAAEALLEVGRGRLSTDAEGRRVWEPPAERRSRS
jgi:hypothetical protein